MRLGSDGALAGGSGVLLRPGGTLQIQEPPFLIPADGSQHARPHRRPRVALLPLFVAVAIPLHCIYRAKVPLPLFTSAGMIPGIVRREHKKRAADGEGGCRRGGGRAHWAQGVAGCAERVSTPPPPLPPPLPSIVCCVISTLVWFSLSESSPPSVLCSRPHPHPHPAIMPSSAGTRTSSPNGFQPSQSASGGRVMPLDVFLGGRSRAATLLIKATAL